MWNLLTKAWQSVSQRAPRDTLEIGDHGLIRRMGENSEQVAWNDVQQIWVETNDCGPFSEDFYFVILGANGTGALVGQDLAARFDLLPVLQARFAGFDDEELIRACGCTSNAMFLLWESAQAKAARLGDNVALQDT